VRETVSLVFVVLIAFFAGSVVIGVIVLAIAVLLRGARLIWVQYRRRHPADWLTG
jgi:hypothetical protein